MSQAIIKKTSDYFKSKGVVLPSIKELQNPVNINEEIKIIPSQGQLPDTMESKELMIATIKNSNLTMGINTTAMVDSIILKTPCISIIKDEFNFNQSDLLENIKRKYLYKVYLA